MILVFVVDFFCILDWTTPVVLWPNDSGVEELGLAQLKLTLNQVVRKLGPLVGIFVTCLQQEILSQKMLWYEKHNTAR